MKVQKILKGRRLSLPVKWMQKNNLEVGDWVIVKWGEKYIEIIPAKVVAK